MREQTWIGPNDPAPRAEYWQERAFRVEPKDFELRIGILVLDTLPD